MWIPTRTSPPLRNLFFNNTPLSLSRKISHFSNEICCNSFSDRSLALFAPFSLLSSRPNRSRTLAPPSKTSHSPIHIFHRRTERFDLDPIEVRQLALRRRGEQLGTVARGPYVRDYVTGLAYRFDLEMVARESLNHARTVEIKGDGLDAWIFDIDETLLSNLPYYTSHGYGLELFNAHEFDIWVEKAIAPAIESSLILYEEVRALGFKIFLLTGRSEGHMNVTIENLKRAGFLHWDKLILRGPNDKGKTATAYKSEKRREIEEEGYRIHGNSGDQWSDLLGYSVSSRSFKLPNPMYFIP
ncbi:hypothetical protein LUZ62_060983 [Rhynchospora pubera]|uniref:Acid phosphatase n=1 Tax=Rhynchospora pubera TaxID=906938 RepID=A0AAV8EF23_9POAL|nr:hypothetical protein LUZ62_060983 [Rhynchospora pubera]